MFKIPFENIAAKVDASEKLTKGLRFIDTIIEDMVVPDGIVPVVAGGAVRDVLIKGDDPHDIDIFFVRNNAGVTSNDFLTLLHENLILWLEDKEIEWTTLARTSQYQNDDSYIDIMDFVFEGVNIQLMVPSTLRTANSLVERFPLMCRAVCNKTGLYFTATGFSSMTFDRPVMINDRDLRYCQKKYPDQEVYTFVSGNEMYYNFLGNFISRNEEGRLDFETTRVPSLGATFTSWPQANSLSNRFREIVRNFFGLAADFALVNQSYTDSIGGNYAGQRRSRTRNTITATTVGVQTIRWQW